jgi:hypothetical protein
MFEYYESEPLPDNVDIKHGQPFHTLAFFRKRVLLDKEAVDWGVEALFFPINSYEGVKLYRCVKDAKLAHQCQEEAYGFGLGPKVKSALLEFIFPYGSEKVIPQIKGRFPLGKSYGYYTQLADIDEAQKIITDNEEQLEDLRADCMEKLSFQCSDLWDRNIGAIDGRLVMIDFGFATTGTPTQRPRGHFSIETDETVHPKIITDAQGKHHRVTPQLGSFHKGKMGLPFKP